MTLLKTNCKNLLDISKDDFILSKAKYSSNNLISVLPSLLDIVSFKNNLFEEWECKADKSFNFLKIQNSIGVYPVVSSYEMLKTLITNTKITTIQLRIKEFLSNRHLEEEISKSILLAKETGTQLFINDYWEIALKKQAYGIHLGQEDAKSADLKKIEESGVRIGISTHCYHELVYAKHLNPSYIALGPIFETSAKKMDFYPQGLESLKTWIKLSECPVVAIGGVNKKNIKNVSDEKPDGISIISAIIDSKEGPIKSTNKLIQICSQTEGKSVR